MRVQQEDFSTVGIIEKQVHVNRAVCVCGVFGQHGDIRKKRRNRILHRKFPYACFL